MLYNFKSFDDHANYADWEKLECTIQQTHYVTVILYVNVFIFQFCLLALLFSAAQGSVVGPLPYAAIAPFASSYTASRVSHNIATPLHAAYTAPLHSAYAAYPYAYPGAAYAAAYPAAPYAAAYPAPAYPVAAFK